MKLLSVIPVKTGISRDPRFHGDDIPPHEFNVEFYMELVQSYTAREGNNMPEKEIGFVEHWFGHIMVAGIKLTDGTLKIGDTIHFKGHTSDFKMTISAMQINNKDVTEAKAGDDIGVKTPDHARQHDKVFLVTA